MDTKHSLSDGYLFHLYFHNVILNNNKQTSEIQLISKIN